MYYCIFIPTIYSLSVDTDKLRHLIMYKVLINNPTMFSLMLKTLIFIKIIYPLFSFHFFVLVNSTWLNKLILNLS